MILAAVIHGWGWGIVGFAWLWGVLLVGTLATKSSYYQAGRRRASGEPPDFPVPGDDLGREADFIRSLPDDPDDCAEGLPPIGDGFDEV